ncbi:MAG TPA: DNA polymerase III subunit gamma/tau [Geobacteraceae bacterium]|nr:DNA polymerase III subunit gamma/tau [Geobacteraceae bacterium]
MSYLVLARKWRPQTFHDLIGQEHVTLTLKNAIDTGRVAHAFLFTGARGVGKTSSARILAKTLNCENGPTTEPCNACPACREITDGTSVDVQEIDGASNNGVDEIRELRDNVKYLPSRSRYKIFIIDEVHMLSTSAFNALLKTLEEPPPHVKFIFATTEPHKVPITILSRCQRFDFKRIPLTRVLERLRYIVGQEGVEISDEALTMVARKGDGSMRDSLSTLDQVLAFCGNRAGDDDVTAILGVVDRQLVIAAQYGVIDRDTEKLLDIVRQVDESGYNMRHFCHEMIEQFRTLLLYKAVGSVADIVDLSDKEAAESAALAGRTDLQTIQRCISILLRTDSEMSHSSFGRLLMEMAMVKMASLSPVVPVNELLERLKALEGGAPLPPLAADGQPPAYRPSPPAATPARPAPPPRRESSAPSEQKPSPSQEPTPVPHELPSGNRDWPGFVAFVKAKRPMLAMKLEKGSPLNIAPGMLQIGYPKGTIELSFLQEQDYQTQLVELATGYFGQPTTVKIVPLAETGGAAPLSIAEKKTLERVKAENSMKDAANSHPLVRAALEIFDAEIESYKNDR